MTFFFSFILAMFVTMSLIPLLISKAESWRFVDVPDQRKVHQDAIPRIGGLAMVAGFIVPVLLWLTPNITVMALLLGIAVIFGFGICDDRKNLNYKTKFFGQSIGVLIVIFWGGIKISNFPLFSITPLPDVIAIPFTFIFLLGVTNAINLSDGLDGLAGGTTLLTLGVIVVLGYFERDVIVVLISITVLGSILGFLRFNTHPAKIFMGDGGSQFLGFSVGVLAIMLTQREGSLLSPALPLLLLGFPILDTLLVMGQRIYANRSPFSPDKNHIHHKLLALGFDHYEAVFSIYVMQSVLVLSAYFLSYQSDILIVLLYLFFCTTIVLLFWFATTKQWKLRSERQGDFKPLIVRGVRKIRRLKNGGELSSYAYYVAYLTLPVFLVASALNSEEVSLDFGILATCLLAAILATGFLRKHQYSIFLDRVGLYVVCAIVTYFNFDVLSSSASASYLINSYTILLAIVVAIGFKSCKDNKFNLNTLDYLVIFIALLIPNLPGLEIGEDIGVSVAQLLVLFYSVEFILTNTIQLSTRVKPVVLLVLSVFIFKAFL